MRAFSLGALEEEQGAGALALSLKIKGGADDKGPSRHRGDSKLKAERGFLERGGYRQSPEGSLMASIYF